MMLEDKLRRAAAWAGLGAAVLGIVSLLTSPALPLISVLLGLGLALAGASLWVDYKSRLSWARPVLGALALGCALGILGQLAATGQLTAARLLFREGEHTSADLPVRPLPHAAILLTLAAIGLLILRPSVIRIKRPLSSLLASVVVAAAIAALLVKALGAFVSFARPLQLPPVIALGLFLVGVGVMLARPNHQLFRIIFSQTPAGALARRLFFGVTILPATLIGLIVLAMQYQFIQLHYGVVLLVFVLILSGLLLAFLSAETAVIIDSRREEADQSRLLLTARLQEQASQLQETVALRTRELRDANAHLRAVAESNARLALVAHNATNGVVISGADGRIEWVNAAFHAITGYALDEVKGQKPVEILIGDGTDPAAVARLREAERTGQPCKVEILNYTKQKRPFWQVVDLQPVRDAAGRIINFITIQTDVTESRAATERLQQLNQRLELATRAATLGVWEWDAVTKTNQWDDRTLEIYGVNRADFRASADDWSTRLHPDDRAAAVAAVQRFMAGEMELDHSFRILRASDGELRYIRSRAIAQRDATGSLIRIIGTERDVTAEQGAIHQTEVLNERLRLALRSSNFGVWELDIASDRLTWDDRMFEIYGLNRSSFDGSRTQWRAALHPEDAAAAQESVRRVLKGEVPTYDTEFRIVRTDGSIRHIEGHGYLQRDADGLAVRLVGLNRDITGERKLQQALDLAEQRWQLALESTNDGVWDWDMPSGTLYHDERWARMIGYEPQEISSSIEAWRQLVHPQDLAGCEAAAREHAEGRISFYQCEYRMLAKTGEWKWILDRGKVVTRAPDGQALRMVGTHTDITARKELEERVRRTESLNRQVSRIALIGGWELNLETHEIIWSEGTFRIHEVEDTQRQPTLEEARAYYPPEALVTIDAALYTRTPAEPSFDFELPMTTAKGRRIWVRVLAQALFRDGKAVLLQGALQDVTARHESEEARRELEGQLFQAQKMETLGTLAGGIAHDFNNLLTGIIGYHELAADSLDEDHPARMCLTEARNASLRARELVEQILTFGRQSAGGGHTPLDVSLVVEEARRFLRATLPATIIIEQRIAPYCPNVLGDATQIHQVLLNLGSNAAHAMRHHGGALTISVEHTEVTPDLAASLGGPAAGSYVRLSVSDTGHGMDEATRRRIFDPFFTTKNTREGTGLGLAVVHGIVRAHRGAIDVESAPGAGSTFHIYLPAATEETTRNDADLSGAPRGAGEFICVVDDEEVVGSCTKLVLESKGYRSIVYGSSEQCLEALSADPTRCALLVTDQTMPGMQGTELVATLRKLNPGLPVVIMSGYFSKIAPHVLDELGQVELLAKPFTTDELAHAVHRALHGDSGALA